MDAAIAEKGKMILQFFHQKPTNAEVMQVLSMFDASGSAILGLCVVFCLMAHFKETPDVLLLQVDVSVTIFLYICQSICLSVCLFYLSLINGIISCYAIRLFQETATPADVERMVSPDSPRLIIQGKCTSLVPHFFDRSKLLKRTT